MIYTVQAPRALIIIPHPLTHNLCATLCVFVRGGITQHCGTALIVIPSSVSLCAFVLTLSIVQLGLSLASAVSKHTAVALPAPRFEVNAQHQTWFNKSVLLSRGQPPFQFTQFKGTQVQKLFRNENCFIDVGERSISWNNENKTSSWNRRAGHEMKAGTDVRWTVTPVFSICVHKVKLLSTVETFPSCFAAFWKHVEATSHHIILRCFAHDGSLNHSHRHWRKKGFYC